MAQENKTYQKKPKNTDGSNKNSNYSKYKKSGSSNKNQNYKPKAKNTNQGTAAKSKDGKKDGKSENYKSSNYKGNKNYYKNKNYKKKNYNSRRKKYSRNPALETIEEIKTDIRRIEKEIRLEIEEIKSLKV